MNEEEVLPKAANFLWLGNKNGKEKKSGEKLLFLLFLHS